MCVAPESTIAVWDWGWICWGGLQHNISLLQSLLVPHGSRHPVRMGLPPGEYTVTSCLENRTVQSASQMGPKPTRVYLKDGMINPAVGKSFSSWGSEKSAVAVDLLTCLLATPTMIEGAVGSVFVVGACGAM